MSHASEDPGLAERNVAAACVNLFLGYLALFVPDRPIDPSLMSRVAQAVWRKQKSDLVSKLHAVQRFEHLTSRQESKYRCKVLKKEIQAMGDEPTSFPPRPKCHDFLAIHGELMNILQYVVRQCPDLNKILDFGPQTGGELVTVRQNIDWILPRLSGYLPAYVDILTPAIGLLQGLNVGISLSLVHIASKFNKDATSRTGLPLLGPAVEDLAQFTETSSNMTNVMLAFMERSALERAITGQLPDSAKDDLLCAVQYLYQAWKIRLDLSQKQHSQKTSLYHFKGSQLNEDNIEQADLDELFPAYMQDDQAQGQASDEDSSRSLTLLTAQLMTKLFAERQGAKEALSDHISPVYKSLSSVSLGEDDHSPFSDEFLSSFAVMKLNQARLYLRSDDPTASYSFYQDPNPRMAKK